MANILDLVEVEDSESRTVLGPCSFIKVIRDHMGKYIKLKEGVK
jgi:hypothetical protein